MFDRNLMRFPGMGGIMGALAVLTLLQATAIAGQAFALSNAIANLWAGETFLSQATFVAAFFACFTLLNLLRFAQDSMLDRFSSSTVHSLKKNLLSRVFDLDRPLVSTTGTASITVSATESMDEIQSYIRIIPPKVVGMAAISLPLLVCVFATDVVSGIVLTILFPVIIMFMVLLGRQARVRASRQYGAYRQLSDRFIDTLRGLDEIESFGAGDAEEEDAYRFSEKLRTATIRTLSTATLSSAVLDLCATFGVAAVAIMLAFRLMDGSIALAPALFALMMAPEYFAPIRAFASDFHASLDGKNALSAVLDMIGQDSGETPSYDDDSQRGSASLVFDNVSFTYPNAPTKALENVSFTLNEGERVAVIGTSGAGKSSLAALAAGLLKPDDPGSVKTSGGVRFVPQHPYIFRATLMDNVRFYAPDATRSAIERACAVVGLDNLIARLPHGLDTMVGEGERGLSGGEAHRVALARILLDDSARILIFDEPTAHLDIETELELKARLLPVIAGKTVLFATHRMHWLSEVDRVITLEGGRVASIEPRQNAESDQVTLEDKEAPISEQSNRQPYQKTSTSNDDSITHVKKTTWLRSFLSKYRRHVVVALALGLITGGFAALLMFTSGYLISATATSGITLFAILLPVAFVQIFGLGKPVARYLERLVSHDWVLKIASDLRRSLYRSIRKRIGNPSLSRATGEYLAILDDDIAHLQNLYLRVAFPAAIAYLLAVGTAIMFGVFSPPFALAIFALLALCTVALPAMAYKFSVSHAVAAKSVKSGEYASIADDVTGATDWMLSNRSDEAIKAHGAADLDYRAFGARARMIERTLQLVQTLCLGAGICLVVWWAQGAFGSQGTGNPNWIAAFVLGFFPLIEQFATLPTSFASYSDHDDAISRLDEYVETGDPSEAPDGTSAPSPSESTGTAETDTAYVADGVPHPAVRLNNVTYTYPSSSTPALHELSLEIPAGQKVAILGKSGSGKTTLAHIVRASLHPDAGAVALFGRPLDYASSRRAPEVGYISQNPHLFNRTLRDNITLGTTIATDEQLHAILRKVGLDDLISKLPDGLDTIIGETGRGFSGGEAHRIALARVLAADTPIVLVDEPFAALDPDTEQALLNTLFAACEHQTLIIITHHLAQINRFDRVLFIENGCLTLDGAPATLTSTSPQFANLLAFDNVLKTENGGLSPITSSR